jgi:hypothetical protein
MIFSEKCEFSRIAYSLQKHALSNESQFISLPLEVHPQSEERRHAGR